MMQSGFPAARRRTLALVAGLLALALQVLAPVLPPSAMAGAMDFAAATPEEAASFAATCLDFGGTDEGGKLPAHHQTKCPICLSVAQAKGIGPAPLAFAVSLGWSIAADLPPPVSLASGLAASPFASRAPPLA